MGKVIKFEPKRPLHQLGFIKSTSKYLRTSLNFSFYCDVSSFLLICPRRKKGNGLLALISDAPCCVHNCLTHNVACVWKGKKGLFVLILFLPIFCSIISQVLIQTRKRRMDRKRQVWVVITKVFTDIIKKFNLEKVDSFVYMMKK